MCKLKASWLDAQSGLKNKYPVSDRQNPVPPIAERAVAGRGGFGIVGIGGTGIGIHGWGSFGEYRYRYRDTTAMTSVNIPPRKRMLPSSACCAEESHGASDQ